MPKRNKKVKNKNARPVRKIPVNAVMAAPKVKGSGFYKGFLGDVGNVLGTIGGTLLGQPKAGRQVGNDIGSIISKATGWGKYKINRNVLLGDTGPPVFRNGAEGSIIVSRREFVTDVLSNTTFGSLSYNLNPGNPALFPWLSNVANSFEQYEFLGLIFEYRPTSGSAIASTNNALGVVVMSTNYDVLDPPFPDKRTMEAYQYTVSTVPSEAACHPVECKRGLNVLDNLYMRHPIIPPSSDLRFYDLGLFQLATVGMQQANVTVGELWVTYSVRLLKPSLTSLTYSHYLASGTSSFVYQSGATASISGNYSNGSLKLAVAGAYQITALNEVAATTASSASFSTGVVAGTNSSVCTGWLNDSQPQGAVNNGFAVAVSSSGSMTTSTASAASCSAVVCVNNGGDTILCPVVSSCSQFDIVVNYLGYIGSGTHAF